MTYEEIENLKESILEVGLLHPLTVYLNDAGNYTLISGHKRYKALLALGKSSTSKVQCTVIDKPLDYTKECELMARANVHRSSPEQIKTEVDIVNNLWNTMAQEKREYWTNKFQLQFDAKYGTDPKYLEDPKKFKSNRFRPRLDYINQITGLSLSNRTLTTYLKKTLSNEDESIEQSTTPKEKTVTIKHLLKAVDSLNGLIDSFNFSLGKPNSFIELQDNLTSISGFLETVEVL